MIQKLEPLVKGCEEKITEFRKTTTILMGNIKSRLSVPRSVVFFLGEFKGDRAPEMAMVNDGVVKWLKEEKIITTYPTDLAYVNWSPKVLNQMPKTTLKVALKDSSNTLEKELKKHSGTEVTLVYPGALIPGIDQLRAILFWLENT